MCRCRPAGPHSALPLILCPMSEAPSTTAQARGARSSVHVARTLMLTDLERVLAAATFPLDPEGSRASVVDENLLGKPTPRTRAASWQRLTRLYGWSEPAFQASGFQEFWNEAEASRPQLALVQALTRDPLLLESAPFIAGLDADQEVTWPALATYLKAKGASYSEKTLRSAAQNLLSSWAQAGWLRGAARKRRAEVFLSPEAAALLLRHAYLRGDRGAGLYHSAEANALGLQPERLDALAAQAGQRSLLSYKRIGDVLDISFPTLEQREAAV